MRIEWIISMLKSGIPFWIVQILHCMVGGVLSLSGIIRVLNTQRNA